MCRYAATGRPTTAVGVAEVPVAPDVVGGLEAGVGDAPVGQRLAGGEPAHPGADHAGARQLWHRERAYRPVFAGASSAPTWRRVPPGRTRPSRPARSTRWGPWPGTAGGSPRRRRTGRRP